MIQIGCVADDFTGAGDWASFFAEKGIKVIMFNGIPEDSFFEEADVAVVALKTRTAPVKEAVEETVRALSWLKEHHTKQFYIKYCSTFDCRREGNIGPVIDAAADFLGENMTIVCPALPVNGRTVKEGKLYVNGVELQKSPMKDHPLTPMWDCRISELMKEQGRGKVCIVPADLYSDAAGAAEWIKKKVNDSHGELLYFVPDFYEQDHGRTIAGLFQDNRLLTGGSGLCTFLADQLSFDERRQAGKSEAPAILIAGSCSQMTLKQIQRYMDAGKKAVKIDPLRLLNSEDTVDSLWEELKECREEELLIYSSESSEKVLKNQERGKEKTAALLENVLAELTERFLMTGRKRIIVAGGETSGAVTRRLGFKTCYVGQSIAPGVPVMIPVIDPEVRLVLKSGNFGDEEFFLKAIKMTGR